MHESRHAYHTQQAIELARQWRRERRTDTLAAWQKWLLAQKKRLPPEVYQTTWAATDPVYGTSTTETYSHMYGFMYRFVRLDRATQDPATMDKHEKQKLLAQMQGLLSVGEFGDSASQDARTFALDRLVRFAGELSANQRANLLDVLVTYKGKSPFLNELAKRL